MPPPAVQPDPDPQRLQAVVWVGRCGDLYLSDDAVSGGNGDAPVTLPVRSVDVTDVVAGHRDKPVGGARFQPGFAECHYIIIETVRLV